MLGPVQCTKTPTLGAPEGFCGPEVWPSGWGASLTTPQMAPYPAQAALDSHSHRRRHAVQAVACLEGGAPRCALAGSGSSDGGGGS